MTLAQEAQCYLAVVEVFRREGCEPQWRRETSLERAQLTSVFAHTATPHSKRRKSCRSSDH